jgi:hypothetical protein
MLSARRLQKSADTSIYNSAEIGKATRRQHVVGFIKSVTWVAKNCDASEKLVWPINARKNSAECKGLDSEDLFTGNRSAGGAMNHEKQNVDMLGDPFAIPTPHWK